MDLIISNITKKNTLILDLIKSILKVDALTKTELTKQFLDTVISQLSLKNIILWESWLGLKKDISLTSVDRRNRIHYTLRSNNVTNKYTFIQQANVFQGVQITIDEKNNIHELHITTKGNATPANMQNFINMLYLNKPAHLILHNKTLFRSLKELKPFTLKHLKTYTLTQIRDYGVQL